MDFIDGINKEGDRVTINPINVTKVKHSGGELKVYIEGRINPEIFDARYENYILSVIRSAFAR